MTWLESNQAFGGLWAKTSVFKIRVQNLLLYPKR
jgi:hypothetical protein